MWIAVIHGKNSVELLFFFLQTIHQRITKKWQVTYWKKRKILEEQNWIGIIL